MSTRMPKPIVPVAVALAAALVAASPVAPAPPAATAAVVGVAPGTPVADLVGALGGAVEREIPALGAARVVLPDAAAAQALRDAPGVRYVEAPRAVRPHAVPNDPYYHDALTFQDSLRWIDVESAWDHTWGTHDVVVAVVDSGIDWAHRDLFANVWIDPATGLVSPLGAIPEPTSVTPATVTGKVAEIRNGYDYLGHGTAIAGIVAGVSNNGQDVAGIAQVQVMSIKVFHDNVVNAVVNGGGGGPTDDGVAAAFALAVEKGADVIHYSGGAPSGSSVLADAVAHAEANGVLVVAAAGNHFYSWQTTSVSYPAAYPTVLAVGAESEPGTLQEYSNTGPELDLVAGDRQIMLFPGNAVVTIFRGTSFSAPVVTGVAALVKSCHPQLAPAEVREILTTTATDFGAPGHDPEFGHGEVHAGRALELAVARHGPCVPSDPLAWVGHEAERLVPAGALPPP